MSPPGSAEGESVLVRRLDFMFGVCKRRRVRSVPLPFLSGEGPGKSNQHEVSRKALACYGIADHV